MTGCIKATRASNGDMFASLKPEHTQGPEVSLVDKLPDLQTGETRLMAVTRAFICLRCRLVYAPEEETDVKG